MFVEDLAPFTADFGADATLAGATVRAIFDDPGASDLDISHRLPQVQIRTEDVPAQYAGASLVGPWGSFTVREHIPDGTGMSLLLLDRA